MKEKENAPSRIEVERDPDDDVETHQDHALEPIRFAILYDAVHC